MSHCTSKISLLWPNAAPTAKYYGLPHLSLIKVQSSPTPSCKLFKLSKCKISASCQFWRQIWMQLNIWLFGWFLGVCILRSWVGRVGLISLFITWLFKFCRVVDLVLSEVHCHMFYWYWSIEPASAKVRLHRDDHKLVGVAKVILTSSRRSATWRSRPCNVFMYSPFTVTAPGARVVSPDFISAERRSQYHLGQSDHRSSVGDTGIVRPLYWPLGRDREGPGGTERDREGNLPPTTPPSGADKGR